MQATALSGDTRQSVSDKFESMFREHYQMVYRTAYSILASSADAEDVLQTIFLRLLVRELSPPFRSNTKGYCNYSAVSSLTADVETSQTKLNESGHSRRSSLAMMSERRPSKRA